MITIDGEVYDIPIISLKRKGEFLDKFAERTEDGILHRELIGVYFNYELQFGRTTDTDEYAALYAKLTEAVEFHDVIVPTEAGPVEFTMYFAGISDELRRTDSDMLVSFWQNLTVNFIAKSPAATP